METKMNFLEQICLIEGIQRPSYVMYTDYGQKASQATLSSEWKDTSMSSLSSSFGRDYGLGTGYVLPLEISFPNGEVAKLLQRLRAGKHENYGLDHVNGEDYITNENGKPISLDGNGPTRLNNNHIGKEEDDK